MTTKRSEAVPYDLDEIERIWNDRTFTDPAAQADALYAKARELAQRLEAANVSLGMERALNDTQNKRLVAAEQRGRDLERQPNRISY